MKSWNKYLVLRIAADCLITLTLLAVALNYFKIFKRPAKSGFFCDDESLKYPYRSDTVGGAMLDVLSLYLPIILIGIGEGMLFLVQRQRAISRDRDPEQEVAKGFLKLHYNLTPFLCGFALHAILVHTTKLFMGRLRPHFFEVCQPFRQLDGSTCDNARNHGLYIEDYDCNGNNVPFVSQQMLNDVHLSFPSGHSSYIFYSMTFIVLYLQRISKGLRQCSINVGLIMMVVQMFCVLLAWIVAVSRVMDHKHHWSDVLVGIMLGTSVAIAVTLYVCQQLKSVNSWPEGAKLSNSAATSTMTFSTAMPNAILVP